MTTCFEQSVKRRIDVFAEWFVFAIIEDDGAFHGFVAFDYSTGKLAISLPVVG